MFKRLLASYPQRPSLARHLKVAVLGVLVWLSSALGLLAPVDDFFYDLFSSLCMRPPPPGSGVLLLEVDDDVLEGSGDALAEIIRRLRELGARQILFTFTPASAGAQLFRSAEGEAPVVWGRRLLVDRWDAEVRALEDAPALEGEPAALFGVAHVDLPRRGIHRTQTAWHVLESARDGEPAADDASARRIFALEAHAVSRERLDALLAQEPRYLVDFASPVESMPSVAARRILSGEIIRELVQGRIVIAGSQRLDAEARLAIPRSRGTSLISPLEYHGYAVQTLVSGGIRRKLGFPFDLLSMLLLALGGSALLLRCEGVVVPWASALLAVLTLCLSFLAFSVLYVWIPVGGFLLLGGILGIASLYGKVALAGALSRQVLIESRPEEGKQAEEPVAAADLECWPLIAGLINQTLHLNRCLLLEKQPGSDSLKNAISLNCTFNDIGERRRDCCRTPYITAKEAGGPIRVESFLLKPLGKELQYIAPLEHAGDLLGFWVLGVDESRVPSGAFERLISDYAAIISQMVYHHRIRQRERSVARRLEMCLAHDQTSFVYGHLKQSVGQLKRKLRSTEIIIDKIQTATVVFNLFGDIVSMNRRMKALIVQERLKPRRLTALDFLSALTEYDADKAKKVLRHVLLDRQALTMPAKLSSGGSGKHLMHLQPLHLGEAAADGEDARDLAARGILCEVVDARSFTEVYEMKESLARRLGTHLRNELASIDISSALIAESWVSEEQKVHAARLAQEKVSRSMELIVECQQYFDGSRELETLERFPVSSLDAFREALRQVQPLLAQKRLEVQVESPRLMSHCLASRESLSTAFTVLLKLLIGDAMDNSRIEVSAVESEDLVVYELRNHGFGIPNERFQEFLFGEKPQAAGNLKMLRDCIHWAESWGGELEAGSEVGVGTSARLGLVKFI